IMMPPEVLDSLSTRRRATRSCRGRNFMLRCSGVIGIRHQDGNVRVVLSGSTTFALAENTDVPTLSGTDRRRWYYVTSQPVLVCVRGIALWRVRHPRWNRTRSELPYVPNRSNVPDANHRSGHRAQAR